MSAVCKEIVGLLQFPCKLILDLELSLLVHSVSCSSIKYSEIEEVNHDNKQIDIPYHHVRDSVAWKTTFTAPSKLMNSSTTKHSCILSLLIVFGIA